MRGVVRPKHFSRVRIKRYHHWRSVGRVSMPRRRREYRLMATMDSVKNADRKKQGAGKIR